jgi:predicted ATP-dependent Lon-type protease
VVDASQEVVEESLPQCAARRPHVLYPECFEDGAKRALIPLANKRNFLDVSGEIAEKVDPIFFSDPQAAAAKRMGIA